MCNAGFGWRQECAACFYSCLCLFSKEFVNLGYAFGFLCLVRLVHSCAWAKNFLAQSFSFNRPVRLASAGRALKPRAKPTAWDEVCTARMSASASWRRLFTRPSRISQADGHITSNAWHSRAPFKNQKQSRVNYITVRMVPIAIGTEQSLTSIRSLKPPDQRCKGMCAMARWDG